MALFIQTIKLYCDTQQKVFYSYAVSLVWAVYAGGH